MSHRLTFFALPTARAVSCLAWLLVLCVGFVWFWCLVPAFCMCSRSLFDLNGECIQMTDNASSLVRLC